MMPVDTLLARSGVRSAHQMGQRCCRDRDERRKHASTVLGLVVDGIFGYALRTKIAAEKNLEQIRRLRIGERGGIVPPVFDFKDASRLGTADNPSETADGPSQATACSREKNISSRPAAAVVTRCRKPVPKHGSAP